MIRFIRRRSRKEGAEREVSGKALVDPVRPRDVDERVADLDVGENQRLDLGVALVDGVEPGRRIPRENAAWVDVHLSAARLFGMCLDHPERIEAFHVRQVLLAESAYRTLTQDLEPHGIIDRGGQVRANGKARGARPGAGQRTET